MSRFVFAVERALSSPRCRLSCYSRLAAVAGTARSNYRFRRSQQRSHRRARDGQSSNFSTSPTLPRIKDMSGPRRCRECCPASRMGTAKSGRDRHPQGWATVDAPRGPRGRRDRASLSLHGFVSKKLAAPSRSQRIFNQMARQLAGLPRIQPQPMAPRCSTRQRCNLCRRTSADRCAMLLQVHSPTKPMNTLREDRS